MGQNHANANVISTQMGIPAGTQLEGKIIKALSGFYYVKTIEGTYMCRARGIFKKKGNAPLVGDDVTIVVNPTTDSDEMEGRIEVMHERRNSFIRPPVANIDNFLIVLAAKDPDPSLEILDRFLVMSEAAGVIPIIIINKMDLVDNDKIEQTIRHIYEKYYDVHFLSTLNDDMGDLDVLLSDMQGHVLAFAGPSGAGKTSLITKVLNLEQPDETYQSDETQFDGGRYLQESSDTTDQRIYSGESLKTSDVSGKTGRGRHTTRHTEIHVTPKGALVMDTPGFTSFEIIDILSEEIAEYFPDFPQGKCRFKNCKHLDEPDCAIKEALQDGKIAESRYHSYLAMMRDAIQKEENQY